jgi:hypothetical protein
MIWLRPGLCKGLCTSELVAAASGALSGGAVPATLDMALFDVDGALIDTTRSYLEAVICGAGAGLFTYSEWFFPERPEFKNVEQQPYRVQHVLRFSPHPVWQQGEATRSSLRTDPRRR